MDASETLSRAADLLEKPGAWMQGDFWRLADGVTYEKAVDYGVVEDAEPVCFCAYGAISYARGIIDCNQDDTMAIEPFLGAAIGDMTPFALSTWNDAPERTQAEVVAALRQAADLAKANEARTALNADQASGRK